MTDDGTDRYGGWLAARGGPRRTGYGIGPGPQGPPSIAWSLGVTYPLSLVVASGTAYAYDPAQTAVLAVDLVRGTVSRRYDFDEPARRSLVFDRGGERLYAVSESGTVRRLTADGTIAPPLGVDGTVRGSPHGGTVAPASGGVYVGSTAAIVRVGAAPDGDGVTEVASGGAVDGLSVADGRLFVASASRIVAIHAATGIGLWKRSLGVDTGRDGGDGERAGGELDAASDGGRGDGRSAGARGASSPVAADGSVYAVTGGALVALDPGDGSERWRAPGDLRVPPVAADGRVIARADGAIVARDARTGAERWRFAREEPLVAPVGAGGRIYTGEYVGHDARVFCLDDASGEVVWTHEGLSDLYSLVPAGDRLLAKTGNRLVALADR